MFYNPQIISTVGIYFFPKDLPRNSPLIQSHVDALFLVLISMVIGEICTAWMRFLSHWYVNYHFRSTSANSDQMYRSLCEVFWLRQVSHVPELKYMDPAVAFNSFKMVWLMKKITENLFLVVLLVVNIIGILNKYKRSQATVWKYFDHH